MNQKALKTLEYDKSFLNIGEDGKKIIFCNNSEILEIQINEETKKRQKNNDVFAFNNHLLKEIIDLKEVNKQLLESQKQTQNLLDQQQRLALQDKKLLEEYKAENDRLKVLKMPSQETEFKHLDNQYKDEVNALKEKLENLQEQIKDQKRIEEQEKPRKWWGLWRK